jgi:L-histidine Nalpha-methyltransferase
VPIVSDQTRGRLTRQIPSRCIGKCAEVISARSPCRIRELVLRISFGENTSMPPVINVAVHASQFPETVGQDLTESLRRRQTNHKFHYDSVKQTQKWLALHQEYSPSRNDPDCAAIYDRAFEAVAPRFIGRPVHLIGLGCGGGQKDTRLLKRLQSSGIESFYSPTDVSTAMVLVASQAALTAIQPDRCFPFVCDLASANDLDLCFGKQSPPGTARLVTFFGMIPNFEPARILPSLFSLVRPGDFLLFSANLASETEYASGLLKILSQYDNRLTHDWLLTFLLDLGVEMSDGQLRFRVEADAGGLRRIVADFHFARDRRLRVSSDSFEFRAGESIRLFFSYRYTATLIQAMLNEHGLEVCDRWIMPSEEEGVFMCRRRRSN